MLSGATGVSRMGGRAYALSNFTADPETPSMGLAMMARNPLSTRSLYHCHS